MSILGRKKKDDALPTRRAMGAGLRDERPSATDLSNKYAFRRNRTLTGSSSANVTSSNELNAELKSPRAHVHHLTSLRRRLLTYFAAVGLAALGLYLIVSQMVATTSLALPGVASVEQGQREDYASTIDAYYQARPAERLRFLLDESALLSHVQAEHPEIEQLRVEPGSKFGEASVVIRAREPIARWNLSQGVQYVDAHGVVFTRNYFSSPRLEIVDNSGLQAGATRLVASDRFLGFVGRVVAKAQTAGLRVDKVTIPAFTTRQIVVILDGSATGYKLSVDRSAGEQVEDISRIVRYMARTNTMPEYVDVRLSGKAFYR